MTGATFARGSCRALKWMALVGMVFALGAGQAAAQTAGDTVATYSGTTVTLNLMDSTPAEVKVQLSDAGPLALSAWTVTEHASNSQPVTGTSLTGLAVASATIPALGAGASATIMLTLNQAIPSGTVLELDYTAPATGTKLVTEGLVDVGAMTDIEVFEAESVPTFTTTPPALTFLKGQTVKMSLVGATGGNGIVEYTLDPLPAGLTFMDNPTATPPMVRELAGMPTTVGTTTAVYTATDRDRENPETTEGQAISSPVVITVLDTLSLTGPTAMKLTVGTAVPATTAALPAAKGGNPPYTYSVQNLPAGLTFDPATRKLAGTPTTVESRTVVYMAEDTPLSGATTGRTATATFMVDVAATAPSTGTLPFTPTTQANISATVGTAMSQQLPVATGGTGTITYTAAPLPAGLTFTASTRTIAGTPTAAGTTAIIYTATDSATPTPATGGLTFNIVVAAATTPTTTATDGVITAVVVGDPTTDAPVKTIGGVKRVHVTEGALTKLTVTGRWTNEQLAALWTGKTAASPPTPAMVTVRVMAAAGNEWLSPAETNESPGLASFGGQDVVLATDTVEIAIPSKPTTNVGSPLYAKEKSGSISLSLPHDVDAEDEGFMVEVVSGTGIVTVERQSILTTVPPVIVIEDDEVQGIVLTTDPASTTTASTRLYEGSSYKFKAVAKPAREDLPLQVRYDVTTLTGVSVSSRLYTLTESGGHIPVGTGADAKDNVTLGLPANDGDREDEELQIHAEVVSFSLNSGAFDDIDTSTVNFTAVDVHKLPELTVSPSTGTVKEGGEIELTLMIDRNPANTTVSSTEKLEYTNEEVTVMLTMGAGSTAGATDFSTMSVKFPKRTKGLYTAEMKTKVMALADDEIDGGEMLVLDAMLKGSETKNGSEGTSIAGVTTLTIEDETQKLVYAKTQKEVEDAVYAAKKAAEGDDMKFTPGEMMEVMGSALFSSAEGVTVSYSAMSSDSSVASTTVSGGSVMVTAAAEGMADITITAHAMSPSGVKIIDQTDPDAASIMFPVEVGLEALSIELTGPEDMMNLVEGGLGGMVTATANRAVTEAVTVMLMRDRSKSSADDMDFEAEPIVIEAGMMTGSTMVMAVEDDMMENDGNMAEELVLYGMTENNAGAVTGEVKFYLWDAAVPALPVIAQLLLAALMAIGGYRRYRRR